MLLVGGGGGGQGGEKEIKVQLRGIIVNSLNPMYHYKKIEGISASGKVEMKEEGGKGRNLRSSTSGNRSREGENFHWVLEEIEMKRNLGR